jgi:hypothetical protein
MSSNNSNNYQAILEWRRNHPETVSEYNSRFYAENSEKIRAKRRERYRKQQQEKLLLVSHC